MALTPNQETVLAGLAQGMIDSGLDTAQAAAVVSAVLARRNQLNALNSKIEAEEAAEAQRQQDAAAALAILRGQRDAIAAGVRDAEAALG